MEGSGKMGVHAIAVADNVQSPELMIEIAWDGEWKDGAQEMSEHLI